LFRSFKLYHTQAPGATVQKQKRRNKKRLLYENSRKDHQFNLIDYYAFC